MSDYSEPQINPEITNRVQEVIKQGEGYAKALTILDPRLLHVNPDQDIAAGFDIGSEADGVAFAKLGFERAITTNDRSPLYDFAFRRSAQLEDEIRKQVYAAFPSNTYGSSLSIEELLKQPNFHPRLITMLKIAPKYFDEENGDPATFLKRFIQIHTALLPNSLVVLSALNDHKLSGAAFLAAKQVLISEGVQHELFMDDEVPPELGVLGQRVLSIKT